jgi:outer membrane protein assembly factor BamB
MCRQGRGALRLWASLFFVCLCACEEDKVPLTGKREYFLQEPQPPAPKKGRGAGATLPPSIPISSWKQPGYDAAHVLPSIKGPHRFQKVWDENLYYGEDSSWKISADPLLADNRLFVLDAGGVLFCLEASTGRLLWKGSVTPEGFEGNVNAGMVYEAGVLYIATTFSELVACEGATGRLLWRRPLEAFASGGMTLSEGRLFVLLANNTVEVLDAKTGTLLWTHKGLIEDAKMVGNAACAVQQGIVIAPYSSGELFALHAETGDVLWEENLVKISSSDLSKLLPHIRANPVIFKDVVYAIGYSGLAAAIDLRTGTRRWEYEIGSTETPCVTKDSLIIVSSEGVCVCLDLEGHAQWSTSLPVKEERSPTLWRGPIMVNGCLLVSHADGDLVFLSPKDGRILRTVSLEDPIATRPLIAQGMLFVVTQNGCVQAYR